ncbi:fructoselysine 6-kinase [Samsonia erythrinae]|uniref:Sugar/nucleoside kinase (Ribokinase family) n=1 Tax=Samsonia erythrinae TaxID=160434 RepID=A0A4R3VPL3_9GAMM|nr:fructoselysine 6-kinase [Samsonia erythrinae]TCV05142.1 sugar/nucleoside kinase (ribokinase family) [Samsonia erythrinae]
MKYKVIGIGDNVVDKYMHTGLMYPGGNALNFSVYTHGLGMESAFMGVFGDDDAAHHVQDALRQIGVDTSHCRHYHGENGYACINLVDGERTFVTSNKGGALRENPLVLAPDDLRYIAGFDWVHSSLNSYLESQLATLKTLGIPLSFDFSVRGTESYFRQVCPFVDFGFVSCSHLSEEETKNKLTALYEYGCKNVIATRGHDGVFYYDGEISLFYHPDYIKPVDTLGAGDAFLSGFLMSWLLSSDSHNAHLNKSSRIMTAMEAGNKLAGKTLQYYGAFGYGKPFC